MGTTTTTDFPEASFDVGSRILSLKATSETHQVAVGSEDGHVTFLRVTDSYDGREFEFEEDFRRTGCVESLCFSGDGRLLFAGGSGPQLHVWSRAGPAGDMDWQSCAILQPDDDSGPYDIYSIACQLGRCAVSGTGGCAVVWGVDIEETLPLSSICMRLHHSKDERTAVNGVAFTAIHGCLITAGSDCRAVVWDVASRTPVHVYEHQLPAGSVRNLNTATINALDVSPDGATFIAGGYDCQVTVWQSPPAALFLSPRRLLWK